MAGFAITKNGQSTFNGTLGADALQRAGNARNFQQNAMDQRDAGRMATYGTTALGANKMGASSMNGMGADGNQLYQAPSAINSTMNSAVQPGQTTFQGDPNPTNPAAVSGMAPKGLFSQPDISDQPLGNDYDSYINKSFNHAMRTLDPQIQQNEDRFNQSMIDRGLSGGGEAYGQAFDNNSRRYNDLINAAAFNAMNFGANRLDADRGYGLQRDVFDGSRIDADRNYGLQRDVFDLNEVSTYDAMNRAWDGIDYRNTVFNTGREDQQYNQMLSLFGMTPVGSSTSFDAAGANANNVNAQLGALGAQNNLYSQAGQGLQDAVAGVDWGAVFGRNSGGQK